MYQQQTQQPSMAVMELKDSGNNNTPTSIAIDVVPTRHANQPAANHMNLKKSVGLLHLNTLIFS
jgi:hypothetical protein